MNSCPLRFHGNSSFGFPYLEIARLLLALSASSWLIQAAAADSAAPGSSVPRMPPTGIAIPLETKAELEQGVTELGKDIAELKNALAADPAQLLPDVQIFFNAVRYGLDDDVFYQAADFVSARKLLQEGKERAKFLKAGQAPWTTTTGLVLRGYRSKLDGSVQPYGLVVPPSFQPGARRRHRLDIWLHGRNNKLSELSFMTERSNNRGEFTPEDAFVLHPYGRYCNAFKFAGEVDVFEALAHARKHYPIDENRIAIRGFSMGGAGAWHLAAHYASIWAAASPGAGFVDTFIFQKGAKWPVQPPWYQQRLWHLYDVTDYAANLFNCPVVVYSGEIDGQREAAELMDRAMAAEGIDMVHIIGPNTGHKFEPEAKKEVARRMDEWMAKGRNIMPRQVRFTTWTLRYNQMAWVTVDALEQHWKRARVEAAVVGNDRVEVTTTNVAALSFFMPKGLCLLNSTHRPIVLIDGQEVSAPAVSAGSWAASFEKKLHRWQPAEAAGKGSLKKRHGLQGPIDDAFMEPFIMVRPTGRPLSNALGAWTSSAMTQALKEWRLQFRGEPRVLDDTQVTQADMATNNLVLWGDPGSNRLLARIAPKLPIRWDERGVHLAGRTYSQHVPALIYPNPLRPERYVVLNSGFTFADAAPTSNALQVPELPDYAVIDLETQHVVDAGFFDEEWRVSVLK